MVLENADMNIFGIGNMKCCHAKCIHKKLVYE